MFLPAREPLAWDLLLAWLGGRAVPGIEHVADGAYQRAGIGEIVRVEGGVELRGPGAPAAVARVFDLAMTRPRWRPPWAAIRCSDRCSRARPGSACRAPGAAGSSPCRPCSASR